MRKEPANDQDRHVALLITPSASFPRHSMGLAYARLTKTWLRPLEQIQHAYSRVSQAVRWTSFHILMICLMANLDPIKNKESS